MIMELGVMVDATFLGPASAYTDVHSVMPGGWPLHSRMTWNKAKYCRVEAGVLRHLMRLRRCIKEGLVKLPNRIDVPNFFFDEAQGW